MLWEMYTGKLPWSDKNYHQMIHTVCPSLSLTHCSHTHCLSLTALSRTALSPMQWHALTHARTHSLAHALTHARTHARTHSRTHALTHSLTHSLTHTLTHSLTHSHTHTLTHSHSHPHTHPLSPALLRARPCVTHALCGSSPHGKTKSTNFRLDIYLDRPADLQGL